MGYKFLTILFFFNFIVFSQSFEVNYKISTKGDAIDSEKSNYFTKFYNQARKDILNYPMEFIISDNGYHIDFSKAMQVDSEYQKIPTPKSLTLSLMGFSEKIYYENKVTYKVKDDLIIKYELDKLCKWNITNETKTILGYKCYKAFFETDLQSLKKKILAIPTYVWFTPELPVSGGPTIYGNVPGLILQYESKVMSILAEKVSRSNKMVEKINLENRKVMTFIESEKYYGSIPKM